MSEETVTLATYWTAIEAHIARNKLLAAGIQAVVEAETNFNVLGVFGSVGMGSKLLVRECDLEAAEALLAESIPDEKIDAELTNTVDQTELSESQEGESAEVISEAPLPESSPEPVHIPNQTERDIDRALNGAFASYLLPILSIWVVIILAGIFLSKEPVRTDRQRKAIIAMLLTIPTFIVCVVLALRMSYLVLGVSAPEAEDRLLRP